MSSLAQGCNFKLQESPINFLVTLNCICMSLKSCMCGCMLLCYCVCCVCCRSVSVFGVFARKSDFKHDECYRSVPRTVVYVCLSVYMYGTYWSTLLHILHVLRNDFVLWEHICFLWVTVFQSVCLSVRLCIWLTRVHQHMPVQGTLRAEHFVADFAGVECRLHVMRADVFVCQCVYVYVTYQSAPAYACPGNSESWALCCRSCMYWERLLCCGCGCVLSVLPQYTCPLDTLGTHTS